MQRGTKPKPAHLKLLEGTFKSCRHAENMPEPKLIVKVPECPDHIKGEGRKIWKKLSVALIDAGVLSDIDVHNLEIFCNAYSLYREALIKVQDNGPCCETVSGTPIKNPAVNVMMDASRTLERCGALLGLDPSSRTRITSSKKNIDNPFTRLGKPANGKKEK